MPRRATTTTPPPEPEVDEVDLDAGQEEEDWGAQAEEIKTEQAAAAPIDLGALLATVQTAATAAVAEAMANQIPKVVAQAMAANANKPPLVMRANVADRFITGGNRPSGSVSPHLKHYRCERLKSDKLVEYDMERVEAFESGEIEWPRDKRGRKLSIEDMCIMQGQFINFLNGHCYAFTDNQVKCLEWYRTKPRERGGIDDMYEDTGNFLWRCNLCPAEEPWSTREGYDLHMWNVHGVQGQPIVAPGSPAPFPGISPQFMAALQGQA